MKLILASSSQYRQELLSRLRQSFDVSVPDIDETPADGELPRELAIRLAKSKARAVAAGVDGPAVVIGSDQVATLDGVRPIGKPGSHQNAKHQLRAASGHCCVFHTAVCVVRTDQSIELTECVDTTVKFNELSDELIDAYLLAERPYDCAGAAKSEGLGISLLAAINGPDPTALIGLPLIALSALLSSVGRPVMKNLASDSAPTSV